MTPSRQNLTNFLRWLRTLDGDSKPLRPIRKEQE